MEINRLVAEAHQTAIDNGWWEPAKSFGELIALMHSELSEALEHYRTHKEVDEVWLDSDGKPDGITVELADCIIRIADVCGRFEIDLNDVLEQKMSYNKTRSYRHGNKAL